MTILERSVVLLQIRKRTANATKVHAIEHTSDQNAPPSFSQQFKTDDYMGTDPSFALGCHSADKTPSWVDALGGPALSAATDRDGTAESALKKSVSHNELDPSVIDSDQSWLDAQSPAPSPPNECTTPMFREGAMASDLPGSGGPGGADADLSYVTPRERSPPASDGSSGGGADEAEAPLLAESVSRVTTVGRADIAWRFQRTMSMTDIVVPEPEQREKARKPVEELVFFLDLDKCAIYGKSTMLVPRSCSLLYDGISGRGFRAGRNGSSELWYVRSNMAG